MPSPFPGMDPFLEGHLWPDVHHAFAGEIRRRLTPRLAPRYVARLEIYVVEDENPEAEVGILYPDVEVLRSGVGIGGDREKNAEAPESKPALKAPLTIPVIQPIDVRIAAVEIRDTASNQLVTCIEILSPVNKRGRGLSRYRKRRERILASNVHLLEIDLLRRGTRVLASHPRLPSTAYLITLTRSPPVSVEVWPIELSQRLPEVPVPLRAPDADVSLELSPALSTIYDEAAYQLSVDYAGSPPPPPTSEADQRWMRELLERARR